MMIDPDAQRCAGCKQLTLRFNPVSRRWECPCGWHDRKGE
jgi:hypothetical protein